MSGRLEGKAGVVTGAAAGLGAAVVQAACAEGAGVVALDRDAEQGRATLHALVADGGRAVFVEGDVPVEADVAGAIARCRSEFGSFDLIDNNAGIALEKSLPGTSAEEWEAIMKGNLK